jgi:hypothetical protein
LVRGTIDRIVNTYGSSWGHIRAEREPRHVFFNAASLVEGLEFGMLSLGDTVEFDEELDRANGLRAIGMCRIAVATREVAAAPVAAAEGTEA